MQPYPSMNYFQNNPAYQPQYQQPINNPYMDRLNNLQQYQQSLQQPQMTAQMQQQIPQQSYLGGKVVDSIDVVKATDIPMDGNMYYFPKADGTEIYSKAWMPNGTTRILTFKPFLDSDMNISSTDTSKIDLGAFGELTEVFMKRFDNIENQISQLSDMYSAKRSVKKNDKSNADDADA